MALIKTSSKVVLYCVLGGVLSFAVADSRTTYTLTEIPPIPNTQDQTQGDAEDLNDAGQVVGEGFAELEPYGLMRRAFVWDAAHGTRDLDVYAGYEGFTHILYRALAINNSGQVLVNNNFNKGYVVDPVNGIQDVGGLQGNSSDVFDINDVGEVVGLSAGTSFLWDAENGMRALGVPDQYHVEALNNTGGFLVRFYPGPGQPSSAYHDWYLWNAEEGLQQIVDPGGNMFFPGSLSDANEVVGGCRTSFYSDLCFPFIWDPENGMRELRNPGVSGSVFASHINYVGQIVGSWTEASSEATGSAGHAVIWDSETAEPTDLNTLIDADSGWTLTRALRINNNGEILAKGLYHDVCCDYHVFLLTPVTEWTLTTATSGEGTVDPPAGQHWYQEGAIVSVRATPAGGWRFSHWEGATVPEDNPIGLVMDDAKELTAVFVEVPEDLDKDGDTDAVDVQLIINKVLGTGEPEFDGDVNGDGRADAVDVQLVINAALGLG